MVARKEAADAENTADDQAEEKDEAITLSVEGDGKDGDAATDVGDLKEDGSVVGEEVADNGKDRLVPLASASTVPTPGGPGDREPVTKDQKAFVTAFVTQPEVTSENPQPYTEAELNHRFSHVPPAGYEPHKITIQQ